MIATRKSWQNSPLPERRSLLAVHRAYSADDFARIAPGLTPRQMEDKWFIFLEGDQLYLHRSWTGFCIFNAKIIQRGEIYELAEAWVNCPSPTVMAIRTSLSASGGRCRGWSVPKALIPATSRVGSSSAGSE